jgi:hypothetical protein
MDGAAVAKCTAIKPANKAVPSHPAIKPANNLGDMFFIIWILLGAAGFLPERLLQRLRNVNWGKSFAWLLFCGALLLES